MTSESTDPIESWTAKRRVALVVNILKGETSVAEAVRQPGLTVAEVEDWPERVIVGAENALRSRPKAEEALKDELIKKLKQKIGDLVLDNDILTGGVEIVPFGPEDVRRVRGSVSGVSERRSCRVLAVGRACRHRVPTGSRRRVPVADPPWTEALRRLIQQYPTFGYRPL